MATNSTTSLANQFQRKYSKDMLAHAIHTLRLNQFAQEKDLEKNSGAKTVRFFRRVQAASSNVQTLAEGTPITTFTDLTYEPVDVDLVQIGEAMKFTDVVGWTALLNIMKDGKELMGEDCALKADDVTLSTIIAGSPVERYSGGAADFAALAGLSAANGKFTSSDGLDAMTNLQINKAPRITGEYIGIVPPQIGRDLMRDPDWLEASKYSAVTQLFKGEIGSLYGVRYVMTTNGWGESAAEGTRDEVTPTIWASIFTGQGGYGVSKLGGTSHLKPQIIIADKPDKSDPLNQLLIVGWKAFYNAVVLNPDWLVVQRSKTQYVG